VVEVIELGFGDLNHSVLNPSTFALSHCIIMLDSHKVVQTAKVITEGILNKWNSL
jgi:hypothetical protein